MYEPKTISGQLRRLGVSDLKKFKPLINWFGNKLSGGAFDMYWTHTIEAVREFKHFIVVLLDEHSWSDMGGGIQMSKQIMVIYSGGSICSKDIIYRDMNDPGKDDWRLDFDKIVDARRRRDGFSVKLKNTNRNYWNWIRIPISEEED